MQHAIIYFSQLVNESISLIKLFQKVTKLMALVDISVKTLVRERKMIYIQEWEFLITTIRLLFNIEETNGL